MNMQKESTLALSTSCWWEIINQYHLNDLSRKTERYIKRKIRSLVLSQEEYNRLLPGQKKRPEDANPGRGQNQHFPP